MTDQLFISGLSLRVRLGCSDSERAYPQSITLNLSLQFDMETAGVSDDVADTVCYLEVSNLLRQLAGDYQWKLLERMTHHMGEEILRAFPLVESVTVEADKYVLPEADCVRCRRTVTRASQSGA